jgi:hypothetical protein
MRRGVVWYGEGGCCTVGGECDRLVKGVQVRILSIDILIYDFAKLNEVRLPMEYGTIGKYGRIKVAAGKKGLLDANILVVHARYGLQGAMGMLPKVSRGYFRTGRPSRTRDMLNTII